MLQKYKTTTILFLGLFVILMTGCGGDGDGFENPPEKNSQLQTAPGLSMVVQGNYKSPTASKISESMKISDDSMLVAVTKFKANSVSFNKLVAALTGAATSTAAAWNANTTYTQAGNKVFYTSGGKSGVFVNSWWSKNNQPSFTPGSSSPWKLIKRTNPSGAVITNAAAVGNWVTTAVYTGGNFVKGSNTNCYEAKYWTKNSDPILVESVINAWQTPWKASTKCSDTTPAEYGNGDLNPVGGGKPPIERPPSGTIGGDNSNNGDGTPVVPPVIPDVIGSGSDVTPDNPPTPIEVSNNGLPATGYAFLRKVTPANWDWLFPLRNGRYVSNGGVKNRPPLAASDGSKDIFTLANFKKAILDYNAYAKKNNYKQFLNEGTLKQQAQEFLTFFAKSAQETSGAWATANSPWITPETIGSKNLTVWKGGLYWVEEMGHSTDAEGKSSYVAYVNASSKYKAVSGRSYYGRGIIQLSWNYNYGAFSAWLYDNSIHLDENEFSGITLERTTLLKRPDYVASKGQLSMLSAIWFWMTPQGAKPSSHDVMYGDVYNVSKTSQDLGLPQRNDGIAVPAAVGDTTDQAIFAYRIGTVINIVNGGIECNKAARSHNGPGRRVSYYNAFAKYFNNLYDVKATTIDSIPDEGVWTKKFAFSDDNILKSAVCFNQKSYYGW